jgi:hypothetical protein
MLMTMTTTATRRGGGEARPGGERWGRSAGAPGVGLTRRPSPRVCVCVCVCVCVSTRGAPRRRSAEDNDQALGGVGSSRGRRV